MLFHTGYLTGRVSNSTLHAIIPNREIKEFFE